MARFYFVISRITGKSIGLIFTVVLFSERTFRDETSTVDNSHRLLARRPARPAHLGRRQPRPQQQQPDACHHPTTHGPGRNRLPVDRRRKDPAVTPERPVGANGERYRSNHEPDGSKGIGNAA